jgi:hypothetical protein
MKNPSQIFMICALQLVIAGALNSQTVNVRRIDNTNNAGKVEWLPRQMELDTIPFAIPVDMVYEAKNISKDTLFLTSVQPGCACTMVSYDKDPIPPGSSGKIKVTFDAAKEGRFYKLLAVKTNFDPEKALALTMQGFVLPPGEVKEKNPQQKQ